MVQLAGDALSKLSILALYVVMARSLGQDGFGDFTFAISIVLIVEIAGLGTDIALTRAIARRPQAVHQLFWNATAIKLTLGPVGALVAMLVAFLSQPEASVRIAVALLAVTKVAELLALTIHATFRGLEDMVPVALSQMLQRFTTALVGSVALVVFDAGLVTIGLIYFSGAGAAVGYLVLQMRRRGIRPRLEVSAKRARTLAVSSLPLGIGIAFGAVLARVDTIILSFLKDDAAVGLYGAAYRLFEGTLFVSWGFGVAVFPLLSRLGRNTSPPLRRAFEVAAKLITAALLPVGSSMVLFAPVIVETLYGSEFAGAATPTRLLGGAAAFYGLYVLGSYALVAQDRQNLLVASIAVALVANIALNLLLIPSLSADGAALAWTISQVGLTAAIVVLVARATGGLSPLRMLASPLMGAAGMGVTAVVLGSDALGLAIALLQYPVLLFAVERFFFPADLALARKAILGARAGLRASPLGYGADEAGQS